jgi:tRNA threonylcarbamoyladenosine biosynthesis protein TsaB
MLKILINASQRDHKSVQLIDVEDAKSTVIAQKKGDIDLVASLKELLTENNLELTHIDKFEFADGPGSFTGIKMAAAVANVLEWAVRHVPGEKLVMPDYGGGQPNIQQKN